MLSETAVMAVLTPDALKKITAVLSVIRKYGKQNTERAGAAHREALDDIALENAQRLEDIEKALNALMDYAVHRDEWKEIPEHEKPTAGDVLARAEEYALATLKAGSHGKRRILKGSAERRRRVQELAPPWYNPGSG